jgi:hypothetical protein
MIPIMPVPMRVDVDVRQLRVLTPDEVLDGWTINRQYFPLAGTTWEEATEALTVERAVVAEADRASRTWDEFEAACVAAYEDEDELIEQYLLGLDIGVASLTLALNAAGCSTAYSCRGHPPERRHNGGSEHPGVLVAVDIPRWAVMKTLIESAECGAVDDIGGVLIYGADVRQLMHLADLLIEASPRFAALSPMTIHDDEEHDAVATAAPADDRQPGLGQQSLF